MSRYVRGYGQIDAALVLQFTMVSRLLLATASHVCRVLLKSAITPAGAETHGQLAVRFQLLLLLLSYK